MKLTFLGGADEVGASSTLIEIAGKRLLVDVGIRISPKTVRGISGDQLPDLQQVTDAGGPDYILVTHAHTDHTGALPLVLERYPRLPVFATEPTIALTKVLQADAQHIMKNKQEEEGELPLFDEIAVQRLLDAFQPVTFHQPIHLGDGLQVMYYPSGHILGAAMLVIESNEGTLVMSGDVSMNPQRAVIKADIPRVRADFLVMESTYGGRLHANRAAEEKRLIETLKGVIERGGKAIIPAFALGRAQEVLQILHTYRDEVNAPIWVDGMVRSVCNAYNVFKDYLPSHTVRAAKDNDLFFRDKVKAVKSPVQRESIARTEGPAIIVSSSGMLTGGPSAAYVKWLADDERNAIFLTGYQDEEAPGRFVQRMITERQAGKEVTFNIDGTTVNLRCEIGSYSLSAHADEAELISFAESLGAEGIALVHGDGGARSSIAAGLRTRGKQVHLPKSGTSIELNFPKRPWAMGVRSGSHTTGVDVEALWNSLKDSAGGFFNTRELAQAWWGDATREEEMLAALQHESVYFAQDWRKSNTFQVRKPEQVERSQRCRQIMAAHPDLVGKLIVLRDVNQRVRIGIVNDAYGESFDAIVAKAKGRHYPADALVWVIGAWNDLPNKPSDMGLTKQIHEIMRQAEMLRDTLLPFERRQALVRQGEAVLPHDLRPATLPDEVSPMMAELVIALALATDGAVLDAKGLLPQQASVIEPMEQNLARQTALALFPPEARLRKVGMDINRHILTLVFDFPLTAQEQFASQIETVAEYTNWELAIPQEVNQQALASAIYELLPVGASVVKGPSFYIDRKLVQVEVGNLEPKAITDLQQAYQSLTGFELVVGDINKAVVSSAVPSTQTNQMEINAAYKRIREALEPHGLYKTSLKQGQIILSFISPQLAERYHSTISQLAEETGYSLTVHPHPNQITILQIAQNLTRQAGLNIKKGPSIYTDRGQVVFTLTELPEWIDDVCQAFEEQTGYQLVLNT